jgi:hypothetical protein
MMNWIKTHGWQLIVLVVIVVLYAGNAFSHEDTDPAAPSSYGAAVVAMRSLPGISCPGSTGPSSTRCTWNEWSLRMRATTGTVAQLCGAPDVHIVFGGQAWTLRLTPAVRGASPPPPTGSSEQYAQLLDTFNFGNGANWMAC